LVKKNADHFVNGSFKSPQTSTVSFGSKASNTAKFDENILDQKLPALPIR
jgi:hypothetical protein